MAEEIYVLIYVLLISVWVFSDFMEPVKEEPSLSELRACHRYAIADQIMNPSHRRGSVAVENRL